MDDHILIPQYITQWGVLTSFIILSFSFISYKYKYNLLCGATFALFVTSILHWYRMTAFGPLKILDVLFGITVLGLVIFYYIDDLKPKYRITLYYTAIIMNLIFIFNWIITYYQIMNNKSLDPHDHQRKYDYFSLEYTNPHTEAREQSYYYVTCVHLLCVHLIPGSILSYCFIMSNI